MVCLNSVYNHFMRLIAFVPDSVSHLHPLRCLPGSVKGPGDTIPQGDTVQLWDSYGIYGLRCLITLGHIF